MNALITAKIITHSINPDGKELISIEAVAPYFLDAEIEKHGMIASNSSSNRAIPFKTMLESDCYIPQDIRLNEKGMQGWEHLDEIALNDWNIDIYTMRREIIHVLKCYSEVHKQHLNRYLAPFSMQKKILTGTRESWNGVMKLRNHQDADPSIQLWAKAIQQLLDNSKAELIQYGDWHLPYINPKESFELPVQKLLIMSTARCARTSQRLHDGKHTTFEKDLETYHMLIDSDPQHSTPLEHQALCVRKHSASKWPRGMTHLMKNGEIGSGRLTGWIQYRHWVQT